MVRFPALFALVIITEIQQTVLLLFCISLNHAVI